MLVISQKHLFLGGLEASVCLAGGWIIKYWELHALEATSVCLAGGWIV